MTFECRARRRRIALVRLVLWCVEHWLLIVTILFGGFVLLPFAAPIFMALGWTRAANLIYAFYSLFCHQMAQRSFFLFGPAPMVNLTDLPVTSGGRLTVDLVALRAFVGNEALGWKVAWSDRMVYMYGAMWIASLIYTLLSHRKNIRSIHPVTFALLLLPLLVDGGTHLLSDVSGGLGAGFRETNQWLAALTSNAFPDWFYQGDGFGSFNAWMRLISGLTFGVGVVWFAYPYIGRSLSGTERILRQKLIHAGVRL